MHPLEIDVLRDGTELRIQWQDNTTSTIDAAKLRRACSCVECRSRFSGTSGSLIPVRTRAADTIDQVHLVSSSRLLVCWQDGHNKSYYSFTTLREEFPPDR